MGYLRRSRQEYVLLSNSLILFNADFRDMFEAHTRSGAEVTMLYTNRREMQRPEYGVYFDVDENGLIVDMEIDPTKPRYPSADGRFMRKDLLLIW